MRIIGTVGLVAYAVVSVYYGVSLQTPGYPYVISDCAYRVQLLRDRVMAVIEHTRPLAGRDRKADRDVSTLLRETQAACSAKDPELARRIATIDAHFREHGRRIASATAARQELRAL